MHFPINVSRLMALMCFSALFNRARLSAGASARISRGVGITPPRRVSGPLARCRESRRTFENRSASVTDHARRLAVRFELHPQLRQRRVRFSSDNLCFRSAAVAASGRRSQGSYGGGGLARRRLRCLLLQTLPPA